MEIGTQLDRYLIEEQIGAGGMGVVYRARHVTLGSLHAIKVLQHTTHKLAERLLREARAQARISHPHILPVTDFLDFIASSAAHLN